MPIIGDIVYARELGKTYNHKMIYVECPCCLKRRWIEFRDYKRAANSRSGLCFNCITHEKGKTLLERFLSKVEFTGTCWIWRGSNRGKGYGNIWANRLSKVATRVSWELFKGVIPNGLLVCHTCDNPPCVNPDHLFLGTQQDNMNDKVKKGRQFRRSKKMDKLTEQSCKQLLFG